MAIRASLPDYADKTFAFVLGADNFFILPKRARFHTQPVREWLNKIRRIAALVWTNHKTLVHKPRPGAANTLGALGRLPQLIQVIQLEQRLAQILTMRRKRAFQIGLSDR